MPQCTAVPTRSVACYAAMRQPATCRRRCAASCRRTLARCAAERAYRSRQQTKTKLFPRQGRGIKACCRRRQASSGSPGWQWWVGWAGGPGPAAPRWQGRLHVPCSTGMDASRAATPVDRARGRQELSGLRQAGAAPMPLELKQASGRQEQTRRWAQLPDNLLRLPQQLCSDKGLPTGRLRLQHRLHPADGTQGGAAKRPNHHSPRHLLNQLGSRPTIQPDHPVRQARTRIRPGTTTAHPPESSAVAPWC